MDITLFLAQAFGIYLVLGGVGLLLYPHIRTELIERFSADRTVVFIGGFVALLIGTPLVLIHNIWDGGTLEVIVTILVWLTFLKGVVRMLAPDAVSGWALLLESRPNLLKALMVLMVLVGLYLLYVGFGL